MTLAAGENAGIPVLAFGDENRKQGWLLYFQDFLNRPIIGVKHTLSQSLAATLHFGSRARHLIHAQGKCNAK